MSINKKGRLRQVFWRDSRMYITQISREEDFKIAEICSVGYLVKETKDSIVLAGDVLDDGEIRRVIIIPKENIIK